MNTFLKRIFSVSTDQESLGNRFRQKRMQFFKESISGMSRPLRILDVGGNEQFWVNLGFHKEKDINITILNLTKIETSYPNFRSVTGEATRLSEYNNKEFDITFSNSVIEHLYTKQNQIKMANEISRVGIYHFVQTPNKYFIIEPHYLLPYFQFLPKKLQYFILTKTKLSRNMKWEEKAAKQYLDEIRLISRKEYIELFPSSKIWKEKFMGLSKSFIAHNFN